MMKRSNGKFKGDLEIAKQALEEILKIAEKRAGYASTRERIEVLHEIRDEIYEIATNAMKLIGPSEWAKTTVKTAEERVVP
jgi:hypothetical protein